MSKKFSLSPLQNKILQSIFRVKIGDDLVWGGGTALATIYLDHRLSFDLDFFVKTPLTEVEVAQIQHILLEVSNTRVHHFANENRWFFNVRPLGEKEIKIEYVYYPFKHLYRPKNIDGVRVESLKDLTANKVFALYERAEPKDVYDLYSIIKLKKWKLEIILHWVETKFYGKIDMVHLGAQIQKGLDRIDILQPLISRPDKKLKEKIWNLLGGDIKNYVDKKIG